MPSSFDPIVNEDSEILILGSMPGDESLRRREYYGNPRNHFWRILYSFYGMEVEKIYEKRLAFALEHKIALWDVIESCQREGSLDANIKQALAHDFGDFYKNHPRIHVIAFNGGKAYEVYRRQIGLHLKEGLSYHSLPSTSPANTLRFEDKLDKWSILKTYIN